MLTWLRRLWDRVRCLFYRGIRRVQIERTIDIIVPDAIPRRSVILAVFISIGVLVLGVVFLSWAGVVMVNDRAVYLSEHYRRSFWEHCGVACIIAAIAGLGYEIFSHHKPLEEQVRALFAINHSIATNQLHHVLVKLVPDKDRDGGIHRDLRKHLSSIVHSIAKMDAATTRADYVSLRFVSTLMRYADNASRTLSSSDSLEGEHVLVLPRTAAELADEILAEHVNAMRYGDKYDVVSDFSTWKGAALAKFEHELEDKLIHHVCTVRRVFCVFPHDSRMSKKEARSILRKHCRWAQQIHAKTGEWHYNVGVSLLAEAEHIGIFTQHDSVMSFKPQGDGDLSRLMICHSADLERIQVDKHWAAAVKVCEEDGTYRTFDQMIERLNYVVVGDFFDKYFDGPNTYSDDELHQRKENCASGPSDPDVQLGHS